jgi:hypothetical protein
MIQFYLWGRKRKGVQHKELIYQHSILGNVIFSSVLENKYSHSSILENLKYFIRDYLEIVIYGHRRNVASPSARYSSTGNTVWSNTDSTSIGFNS